MLEVAIDEALDGALTESEKIKILRELALDLLIGRINSTPMTYKKTRIEPKIDIDGFTYFENWYEVTLGIEESDTCNLREIIADQEKRLQHAELIVMEQIRHKRIVKEQWTKELQGYVEEYCDLTFIHSED